MVILTGVDDGAGSVADPQNRANITIQYTGTLWKFLNYPRLTDFTITDVDGTFIQKSTTGAVAETEVVNNINSGNTNYSGASQGTANNVPDNFGDGTGALATIVVNASGDVTSIVITDGGSGYEIGDDLRFTAANIGLGGSGHVRVDLTATNMVPNYEQLRVNLEQVYIRAEDITAANNSTLKFTIYNTLNYALNYKYANILRAFSAL